MVGLKILPGKTYYICNVAEAAKIICNLIFIKDNIQSAFKSTGIFSLNRCIYTEVDFLTSEVTTQPMLVNVPSSASNSEIVQNIESSRTLQRAIISSHIVCSEPPPLISDDQLWLKRHKSAFPQTLVYQNIQIGMESKCTNRQKM